LIPGMEGFSDEERLSRLGLDSLEFRRMRGDLIETYWILRGFDRVDAERLFPPVGESRTRGHYLSVRGHPLKTDEEEFLLSKGGESVEFFTVEGCGAALLSMFKIFNQ